MTKSQEANTLLRQPSVRVEKRHGYPNFQPTHLHLVDEVGRPAEWQSRRARKGRYSTKKHHIGDGDVYLRLQDLGRELKPHLMVDVSFWIAVFFTIGSVVWVVNGFLAWLPFVIEMQAPGIAKTAAATALIGGILFEIGAYLMVVEALDRGRETNFGTALYRLLQGPEKYMGNDTPTRRSGPNREGKPNEWPAGKTGFVWWGKPMWDNMGYVAAIIMFCSASIFWVATLTGLPGVIPDMAEGQHRAISDVFFWSPQVIGGVGFVISSLILILEVQHHWWAPRPLDIGWQVGFWNLVGALGFLLCGILGYATSNSAAWASSFASFIGSWAFLIGSIAQLWEVIWREPSE